MSRFCKFAAWAFLAAYILALFLFLVGTFGWFGQTRDPLSGIFLIPLGLPWNLMIEGFPEALWPWLGAAAPTLNLVLLRLICGQIRQKG
ncbi:hypothetical protein [Pseudoruegeria sp. SHC-113]|uniref:hypothetical protein n=1 Tax=Pseudoruegeria sp. SHC-113 TaxID=2855439 RepID=UPI0021BB7A8C|nr:hypothetical protein [Pseudoruegeria sp. SHC-113]MCT8160022.1 hypothetical protein [Pseudoruegeria sp. SHC-113]